jgi:hypothetical protein
MATNILTQARLKELLRYDPAIRRVSATNYPHEGGGYRYSDVPRSGGSMLRWDRDTRLNAGKLYARFYRVSQRQTILFP